MGSRTILGTLSGPAPRERLQVELVQRRDGRLVIDLRQQHYAEGIGWYDQRGIELDPRQLRQLQAMLGAQAPRIEAELDASPVLLPFPGPGQQAPHRPAVGDGS